MENTDTLPQLPERNGVKKMAGWRMDGKMNG